MDLHGIVWCVGADYAQELIVGQGYTTQWVAVPDMDRILALRGTYISPCGMRDDGSMWCFGNTFYLPQRGLFQPVRLRGVGNENAL